MAFEKITEYIDRICDRIERCNRVLNDGSSEYGADQLRTMGVIAAKPVLSDSSFFCGLA